MDVRERILRFVDHKGLSKARFERECGLSNGYLKNIRKSISVDKLELILRAYPELNRDWLLAGVGEMLNTPSTNNTINVSGNNNGNIHQTNGSVMTISGPVSNHNSPIDEAQAVCLETGAVEGEAVEFLPVVPAKLAQSAEEDTWEYIQQNPVPRQPVVMQFPDYHTTLQVRSDAMAPRLRSGDHVALRHMGKNPKVMNGEVYCFDTRDGGLVIREGTNIPGGYRLHARSERYADDVLMYDEVLNVYEVVGAVIMNI